MKTLLLFIAFLCVTANATQLALFPVKMPLYLHGGDGDTEITIADILFASANSIPDSKYAAIVRPFIPLTDGSWKNPADINLASLYGFKIIYNEGSTTGVALLTITIDATNAKVPEGYPFSIAQVTDAVLTCVKLMTPIRPGSEQKVTINLLPPVNPANK